MIRAGLLAEDFKLADSFCDAQDLEAAWKKITIPPAILTFFATLFNFNADNFSKKVVQAQNADEDDGNDNDDDDRGYNEDFENENDDNSQQVSETKKRKVLAIYQILYYVIHCGRRRTPLHVLNAEAIHSTCKSKTLISSFNHFGLCMGYQEVRRYHNDMSAYIILSSPDVIVPLPSHFDPGIHTTAAFDNFDHDECTDSGIGGSHDTVSILMQQKSPVQPKKPRMSETQVIHGKCHTSEELPCQKLLDYIKPAKKPTLPEDFVGVDELFSMDELDYSMIQTKDMAWLLSRLDLSEMEHGTVKPIPSEQTMPSWSAFNSVVTQETLPEKAVGFLPVLPHPVTDHSTVYTALKNFQSCLNQLHQTNMAVTCDEGVYHVAKEIMLAHPGEFQNIVLWLGSFHMIKVVMGCIGKYIEGSGAEKIWTQNEVFGLNVVQSVIGGTHYSRSLKGLCLLAESMERLQWCQFFTQNGVNVYENEMKLLNLLKNAVALQDRDESKRLLQMFSESSDRLTADFEIFQDACCKESENFKFWAQFIKMVQILKDIVRADREGDWNLHLHSVRAVMPLFASCDRVNYLRWGSVYIEEMQMLPQTAPDVYDHFMAGGFTVKHTAGCFKSVGTDQCLEQTINRSQKSQAGIIGTSKRKAYVAQWEIIHHEMLAVSNLHRLVSGISTVHDESDVSHEFSANQTSANEEKIKDMITFIVSNENPMDVTNVVESKLHNILTQEIMTDEIRKDLLHIEETSQDLYTKFRKDRFIEKTDGISDTIHRTKLKTFKSIHADDKRSPVQKKNDLKKETAQAQKIIDIARIRDYDMKKLFCYDIIPSNYLFDKCDMMTGPQKSDLVRELEKKLKPEDYVLPRDWTPQPTAYIVDVMSNMRKVKTKGRRTFGELIEKGFVELIENQCMHAKRIDFVFDSYIACSVKDSERERRTQEKPIEISVITEGTPLPIEMNTFWPSSDNKRKLQRFLRDWLVEHAVHKFPGTKIVVSGTCDEDGQRLHCQVVDAKTSAQTPYPELDSNIEEADVRIIPHAINAADDDMCRRVVVLSNDTDVVVLCLHFFVTLKQHGVKQLWLRGGVGSTTRYIPLHILARKLGAATCKVLLAVHILTGCDITSKVGTKAAALKAHPLKYLSGFAQDIDSVEEDIEMAEQYLVQVFKNGSDLKTMDGLRYSRFHHAKNCAYTDLPPTSFSIKPHIRRAFYGIYLQMHCLNDPTLDPRLYGFEEQGDLLAPVLNIRLLPDDLPQPCTCGKCATKRCVCRKNKVSCCIYCKCRGETLEGNVCLNPHVVLKVPVTMAPPLQ